jgi:hypothetical protein
MSPFKQKPWVGLVLFVNTVVSRAAEAVSEGQAQLGTAAPSATDTATIQAMADFMPTSRSAALALGLVAAAGFIYQRSGHR